jgi:hypothetical protein
MTDPMKHLRVLAAIEQPRQEWAVPHIGMTEEALQEQLLSAIDDAIAEADESDSLAEEAELLPESRRTDAMTHGGKALYHHFWGKIADHKSDHHAGLAREAHYAGAKSDATKHERMAAKYAHLSMKHTHRSSEILHSMSHEDQTRHMNDASSDWFRKGVEKAVEHWKGKKSKPAAVAPVVSAPKPSAPAKAVGPMIRKKAAVQPRAEEIQHLRVLAGIEEDKMDWALPEFAQDVVEGEGGARTAKIETDDDTETK